MFEKGRQAPFSWRRMIWYGYCVEATLEGWFWIGEQRADGVQAWVDLGAELATKMHFPEFALLSDLPRLDATRWARVCRILDCGVECGTVSPAIRAAMLAARNAHA